MADFSSIAPLLSQMADNIEKTTNYLKELVDISSHLHDAHWHGVVHASDNIDIESGPPFVPIPSDEVSFLLSEFNNKLDKDDNGLVYGIDFLIDSKDPMCPQQLRYVEQIITSEDKELPNTLLNWEDYLKTAPGYKE